jgi:hypothetical protein
MPDGSKAFIIGNIEEVAVASSSNVDARRALSGTGSEYLRSLEKEYRQKGVFINDPKGLFIFRWYREVKADGSPVIGKRYQNPQCSAYQLTLDNDGDPFVWTSNYQVISKVYLKKHSSQPRTYVQNKKDGQMVKKAMAKMVGPTELAAEG